MTLADNHTEYWKTIRRGGEGLEGYTIGFPWFPTFPTSKRPWFFRDAKGSVFGEWIVTRSQIMRGLLLELDQMATRTGACAPAKFLPKEME